MMLDCGVTKMKDKFPAPGIYALEKEKMSECKITMGYIMVRPEMKVKMVNDSRKKYHLIQEL